MENLEAISDLLHLGPQKPLQPPRFAKVAAVAGDTVTVALGQGTAEATRCCLCNVGDVVLLETLPNGTLAAVATRGAAGGGSVPQNLTYYGTCTTAAGTATKEVTGTAPDGFTLSAGVMVVVYFQVSNTVPTNVYLNVNGTGAKRWVTVGSGNAHEWQGRAIISFIYDGSYWRTVAYSNILTAGTVLPTSANVAAYLGGMQHLIATSTMTTGHPTWDGHIIDMGWTNSAYDGQLSIPKLDSGDSANASNKTPEWRACAGNSNTAWSQWYKIYSEAHPPTTDEISGTYTDGIWTVRKWADGTAECWGSYDYTIASWNAWGSMYVSATYASQSYPSGLFTAKPIESAMIQCATLDGWTGVLHGSGSASATRTYYITRPTAGGANESATFTVRAVGRWMQ